MTEKIIKIEFKAPLELNFNESNQGVFKRNLVNKIKEMLNAADIEDDWQVYESAGKDIQEIVLTINNKKSDQ